MSGGEAALPDAASQVSCRLDPTGAPTERELRPTLPTHRARGAGGEAHVQMVPVCLVLIRESHLG